MTTISPTKAPPVEELWHMYDQTPKVRCTPHDTETGGPTLPTQESPLADRMEFVWNIEKHTHVDCALVEHKTADWYALRPSCYRAGDTVVLVLLKADLP